MQTNEIDMECPLCLKLLCEPCSTTCGHNFCQFCIYRSLQTSTTCPLCREDLHFLNRKNLRINILLQEFLKNSNPEEYQQRLKEQEEERRDFEQTEIAHRKIYIGNEHSIIQTREFGSSNCHRWKFFIRMDQSIEKYIDRVTIRLHPTFTPNTIVLTEPPFVLSRIGWGIFNIKSLIHFKPMYNKSDLLVDWMLSFDGDGDFKEMEQEFVSKKIMNIQQQPQEPLEMEQGESADEEEYTSDEDN